MILLDGSKQKKWSCWRKEWEEFKSISLSNLDCSKVEPIYIIKEREKYIVGIEKNKKRQVKKLHCAFSFLPRHSIGDKNGII